VLRILTDEQGRRERRWCPMNKGVSNMWRYFQVGIGANQRYPDPNDGNPFNTTAVDKAVNQLVTKRPTDAEDGGGLGHGEQVRLGHGMERRWRAHGASCIDVIHLGKPPLTSTLA
jgi:hypothetical protein